MSAHYDVIPMSEIIVHKENMSLMEELGFTPPEGSAQSRNPTTEEVRDVISELIAEGLVYYEAEFGAAGDDLDAAINGELGLTIMSIHDYLPERDETKPHRVSFQYGEQVLVLTIAERLSNVCGPFLLTQDASEFVIAEPGIDPTTPWVAGEF